MTPADIALVAALGASAITACATLGVVTLQERLRGRAADRDTLASALTEMLSRSMAVMTRANALSAQIRLRSGAGEGLDVILGLRKPADALQLHDWMAADMAPLNTAWSVIWARGDQETVRLANALLSACGDAIGAATATAPTPTMRDRLRRLAAGEKITPELQAEIDRAVRGVAHAREQLAQHARTRLGLPPVQLFGHDLVPSGDAGDQNHAVPEAGAAAIPASSD